MTNKKELQIKRLKDEIKTLKSKLARQKNETVNKQSNVITLIRDIKKLLTEVHNTLKITSRYSERVLVTIVSDLIVGDKKYSGIIENISENGIYMITSPIKEVIDITPKTKIKVEFKLPSKKTLTLNGKVIWSRKTPPHFLTNSIGLQIARPPLMYKKFIKTLK